MGETVKRKAMKRSRAAVWIAGAAAAVLAAGVAGVYFGQRYYDRLRPNFKAVSEIKVYPGTTVEDLEAMILRTSSVRRPASLHRVFKEVRTVRPGHYLIRPEYPSVYVARMCSHGWQSPVRLTLAGSIRSQGDLAAKLSRSLLLDSSAVISALRDSALLARYGFSPEQVFALFIPDTYEVMWTDPMPVVLDRMKAVYDRFWTKRNRKKAEEQGLDPIGTAVLASIVEGESRHAPELPVIAGVYLNRLRKGMKLQADPTVAYCFDYQLDRILDKHTGVDSPFNTYLHPGLPPAPICVPSRTALEAVLNPDRHDYLYFCASPEMNGTHLFAKTYGEHLRNARAFRRALTVRQAERRH